MNQKKIETLLKQMADSSEVLAIAHADLVGTNAALVDVLIEALAAIKNGDAPQTMQ